MKGTNSSSSATPDTENHDADNNKDSRSSKESGDDIYESILIALRTLQLQNKRLAEFQENSYKWHIQHHNNIKKIISGLNMLSESFEKSGIRAFEIDPQEDKALLDMVPETPTMHHRAEADDTASAKANLHKIVLAYKNNIYSPKLDSILRSVDDVEMFRTLREESLELLFPVITKWLSTYDTAKIGLVYLVEGARNFASVFSKPSAKDSIQKIAAALEELYSDNEALLGLEIDPAVVKDIYHFLTSAQ